MSELSLRPYQREALDAIYDFFHQNDGNPVVSIPTGAGKSLIIAQMLKESFGWWPDTRVLILTHVKELIAQNFAELAQLWPFAPAGIYSSGLNRRDIWSPIIFGGIQSLHNRAHLLPRTDLVIVDEAHLVPRKSSTMYRKFLTNLTKLNPYLKVVGLTATPFRLDSGMLTEGEDAIFTDLVYEANVKDLVEIGFLSPPIGFANETEIDTTGVGLRGGEFIPGQLEAAALDPGSVARIADEICRAGADRKGWLVFACGIKHANMLADALSERGISTATAFGDTPSHERHSVIEGFRDQKIQALVTVGILTTGFNARHVDLIACARPTKSPGLWIQMVGRGLRLSPETGKENCLILDFGGNLARHGPIDKPIVKEVHKGDEPGDVPEKACPACGILNPIGARWCRGCYAVFDIAERRVETRASSLSPLSSGQPDWVEVEKVLYYPHNKIGKPTSLCVEYVSGLSSYREWVCLEHEGYARQKAVGWWKRRAPEIPVPNTIEEALANKEHIRAPLKVAVRRAGKYFEIVGAEL